MLRRYNTNRKLSDNQKLGALTAIVAGLVNVVSFIMFFSFSSNVTGYYTIMIAELTNGNWHQFSIVTVWILSFFIGSFLSNFIVVKFSKVNRFWAHAAPVILEILLLTFVGIYGSFFYTNSLIETEMLLLLMLFAMGIQNGLTASITNFTVKTTHLTGLTTDLAILFSLYLHKQHLSQPHLVQRVKLMATIFSCYLIGGAIGSVLYKFIGFSVFYFASIILAFIVINELVYIRKLQKRKSQFENQKSPVNFSELNVQLSN
jgi:uncharacterized membrane protein YoaK (UPF0700 family)